METCPDAISGSIIGTKNGLILEGPRVSRTPIWLDRVVIPPIPLAIITETRLQFAELICIPLCSIASMAEAAASWTNLSIRLACFLPTYWSGSKSVISAAKVVSYPSVSKVVMSSTPETPLHKLSQVALLVRPTGLTAPYPVTNTLSDILYSNV